VEDIIVLRGLKTFNFVNFLIFFYVEDSIVFRGLKIFNFDIFNFPAVEMRM